MEKLKKNLRRAYMFTHDKKLLYEVKVNSPNPNYAALLQELDSCRM